MNARAARAAHRNANIAFATGLTSAIAVLTVVVLYAANSDATGLVAAFIAVPIACALIGPWFAVLALRGSPHHWAKAIAGALMSVGAAATEVGLAYWLLSSADGAGLF